MGFFSWLDAKSRKSIANVHSGHPSSKNPVYLLQPNGLPSIEEPAYDGYGVFGGVDVYAWLCETNLPEHKDKDLDFKRDIGVLLELDGLYLDVPNGKYYSYHFHHLFDEVSPFEGNFGTVQSGYSKTPNELIKSGEWVTVPGRQYLLGNRPFYPIKLTYDAKAVYEECGESESDPAQGFFYSESDYLLVL